MNPRTRPLYPLQDWTEQQWCDALEQKSLILDGCTYASKNREALFEKMKKGLTNEEWKAIWEYQYKSQNEDAHTPYLSNALRTNYMYERDFPLGLEESRVNVPEKWKGFAVQYSGDVLVLGSQKRVVSRLIWCFLCSLIGIAIVMLFWYLSKEQTWDLASTTINQTDPLHSETLNRRTKDRGTVASLLSGFTFSLFLNSCLDKWGRIEPSTSTVFVGIGGTWGFVLDNMIGADEGFREYRWNSYDGMRYGLGSLQTARYGRYVVTILFDMFFSVILFKPIYSRAKRLSWVSDEKWDWLVNGLSSFLISFLTYQVYANLTRFEWASPSGVEDVRNQWISGQTMLLATVMMNMVYLVSETRMRVGEPGINDPRVKMLVTLFTFCLLAGLQIVGVMDPSLLDHVDEKDSSRMNTTLPLRGVCQTQESFVVGLVMFLTLCLLCFSFVIFATSQQTLDAIPGSWLWTQCVQKTSWWAPRILLLSFSMCSVGLFLVFFTYVPLWSESDSRPINACVDL